MRQIALVAVVLAALVLSAVHWLGLLIGGIAVGLLARTWPRALVGGAVFGFIAWLAFLLVLGDAERLAAYWQSGVLLYVSLGIPIVLGILGSLSHGLKSGNSVVGSTSLR